MQHHHAFFFFFFTFVDRTSCYRTTCVLNEFAFLGLIIGNCFAKRFRSPPKISVWNLVNVFMSLFIVECFVQSVHRAR